MSDEHIRQLLLDAAAPVGDPEEARQRIQRRVGVVRRRRTAAGGLVAVALFAVAAVAVSQFISAVDAPVISPNPPGAPVPVSTACGDFEVDPTTAEYLRDWATGEAVDIDDRCMLTVLDGPSAMFDTSELGPEQRWQDDPAPEQDVIDDDAQDFWDRELARAAPSYPVVFIGTNPALDAGPEGDTTSKFLWWHAMPGPTPSPAGHHIRWCMGGGAGRTGCGPLTEGIQGLGADVPGGVVDVNALVPPETAAAQLLADGEVVAWHRPRGRVVWFAVDLDRDLTTEFTLRAYAADGRLLGEYDW